MYRYQNKDPCAQYMSSLKTLDKNTFGLFARLKKLKKIVL